MVKTNEVHSGTLVQEPSKREIVHGSLAREAAVEGIGQGGNEIRFLAT